MLELLKEWDRELFIYFNSLGIERFDGFWVLVTQIETWTPLFLFFLFLIFYFYKLKKGLVVFAFIVFCFTITLVATDLTKEFVARLRPNNVEVLGDLIRILQKPTNYSFFSGHASTSFAITTFMVLAIKNFNKWIWIAYLWPLVFVVSRIYVGVHYPSDILVGAFVGTCFAFLFWIICKKLIHKIY